MNKVKIREYSDFHLDWYFANGVPFDATTGKMKCWFPPEMPDDKETILILAGDLWIGIKFIEYLGFSWISQVAPRFKQVLIVLGNHDYWPCKNDLTIKAGADKCNKLLQDMCLFNVKVLDMDTYVDGEYLFVGATLWTDMNKGEPLAMHNMSNFMAYDGKIAYDTGTNGAWSRFTSDKWVQTHMKHRDYIKHVAAQNRDKQLIVITHHVPLMHLGDPIYQGNSSNAYYMSDLSDLILDNDNIKIWFFGHTHHASQTVFPPYAEEGDGCRMINNCVGYQGEHLEQLGLVKHVVIEI